MLVLERVSLNCKIDTPLSQLSQLSQLSLDILRYTQIGLGYADTPNKLNTPDTPDIPDIPDILDILDMQISRYTETQINR